MKTTGLTFLQAVKALKDGMCEGIRRPIQYPDYVSMQQNDLKTDVVSYRDSGFLSWVPENYLATDFELVNPKPRTEPVECDPIWRHKTEKIIYFEEPPASLADNYVRVTGTYQLPIPEPEPVEVEGVVKMRTESGTGRSILCVQLKRTQEGRNLIGKRVLVTPVEE